MSSLYWLILGLAITILTLIIVELRIAKRKKVKIYNFSDSFTNFFCGMLERVFDVFFSVIAIYIFVYVQGNISPFKIELSPYTWIIGLVVTDFIAYWFHRWSHQVNFLWAAHIVHHQSEELNITTVFRVSFFAVLYRACFFVWMALAGFDIFIIVSTSIFLGCYQLFTHSRVIGNLGVLEYFMTTPSHHRVHHARNEKYMDRNYAHIFIIWDRIFGTFKQEEEEPDYGITSGFNRANAYNATFSYWKNLFSRAKQANNSIDKIKVFLKGPKWTPKDVEHLPPVFDEDESGRRLHQKFETTKNNRWYNLASILITIFSFVGLMIYKSELKEGVTLLEMLRDQHMITLLFVILFSIYVHSSFIEQKKNAFLLEFIRLLLIPVAILVSFHEYAFVNVLSPICFIYCGLLLVWSIVLFIKGENSFGKAIAEF